MTRAGDYVGCVSRKAGADSVAGGVAVVTDKRLDVGGNCGVAASAGDSAAVPRVVAKGEEGC